MSAMSKSFVATLGHKTCEQLYHPGQVCWQMTWSNMKTVMPACMTYFLPLILIAPLRKMDDIKLADLKESFGNYCRMCVCIYCCSVLAQTLGCALNNVCSRNYMPLIYFLPVFVGDVCTFMLSQKQATIVGNSTMTMIVESFLMRDDTRLWRLLLLSPALRTMMFMCLSGIIMDSSLHIKKTGVFWFISPTNYQSTSNASPPVPSKILDQLLPCPDRVCRHRESCDSHIISGMKTYFKVAIGLELFRIGVSRFADIKSNPIMLPVVVMKNINWRVAGFLVGYSALYRTLNCTTNRYTGKSTRLGNWLASFVSAASYYCYPNRTVLAHTIVSCGRLLWSRITDDAETTWCPAFLRQMDTVPWSYLFHMFGVAYIFHLRVFYPYWCPSMLKKTTSLLSGYNFDKCLKIAHNYYLGFE